VKEYEKAGIQAIQLEDQVFPKRCGHMAGKSVVPIEEMRAKLLTAVDSRQSEDTLIIARTDILALQGFDAAIERGNLFAEWGADIIFVEAPCAIEEVKRIPQEIAAWTLINIAPKTPDFSVAEIEAMGFSLAIYPGICITATLTACKEELSLFRKTGKQNNLKYWVDNFNQMNDLVGLSQYREKEKKYTGK